MKQETTPQRNQAMRRRNNGSAQKGANHLNPQTYMASQRFHKDWLYEAFDKLSTEKTKELFNLYDTFNSGVLLFDPVNKEVILGEYYDKTNKVQNDLSHFGGGLSIRDGETPLTAAMRELGQESQWLLGLRSNLAECPGILAIDKRRSFCYIVFFALCDQQDLDYVKDSFQAKFKEAIEKKEKIEVKSIQTIELELFIQMIRDSSKRFGKFKIYEIIRRILDQYENKVGIKKTFDNLIESQKAVEIDELQQQKLYLMT